MRTRFLSVLLVATACSSPSGEVATTTTTTAPPPPVSVTTSTSTTSVASTTTTLLEPDQPDFDTWAIVLASLAADEYSLEQAIERADGYETPAGVLHSDEYPSLNPGWWVVFNGPFPTSQEATMRCDALKSQTPSTDCYTRYLGVDLEAGVGLEHGTVLASVEGGFGIFDLQTGERIRTIEETAEARYRRQPQLALDGTVVFFDGNVEDYWFSCESAQGFIDRLDLTTGAFAQYAVGANLRVSPGGQYLAYVEASGCIDDPIDFGYLATPDTIVVVDLLTGAATRWAPRDATAGQPASFVTSLAWGSNSSYLLVVLGDGSLRRLEPAQTMPVDELPIVDAEFVAPLDLEQRARTSIDLVAGRTEASIVAHQWSSVGTGREGAVLGVNEIIEIDPRSGAIQRTVSVLGDAWPLISIDSAYQTLLVVDRTGAVPFDGSGSFPKIEMGSEGADW